MSLHPAGANTKEDTLRGLLALLALGLAGCVDQQERARQEAAADAAQYVARVRALAALTPDQFEAQAREQWARDERDRQAALICRARGGLAATQPTFGGFGVTGGIAAGMQQAWAGANAEAICLETYRATGIMPGY